MQIVDQITVLYYFLKHLTTQIITVYIDHVEADWLRL